MRFLISLLVRFEPGVVAICDAIGLPVYGDTSEEALAQLRIELQQTLDVEGVDGIQWANHHDDPSVVPCPEATIKLPVDLWYCKVTKRSCPIQGHLDPRSLTESLASCDAPERTKSGVQRAFQAGYEGLHHMTGKYRCPLCPNKGEHPKNFHYRPSVTLLSDFLDVQDGDRDDLRARLMVAGLPPSLAYTAICPDCVIACMKTLGPPYEKEAAVLRFTVEISTPIISPASAGQGPS